MHALEALVATVKGTAFAGLDTVTVVKLAGGQKNPMQGRVTKVMEGASVMLFSSGGEGGGYENMVNRRLVAEDGTAVEFNVGPRTWGTRVEGKPIVEYNGTKYLEVIFKKAGEVHYELDGKPIEEAAIIGLPAKKEEAEQGGLEDKVILRTFKFEAIKGIRIAGVKVQL